MSNKYFFSFQSQFLTKIKIKELKFFLTINSLQQLFLNFFNSCTLGVGLHQGSALSPFLFAIIINRLTEDIRKDTPWDKLFADDIVLSRQNHRELEEDLEIWRNALERRGLKVSGSKTEYLRVGSVDDGEELKLQGEKVKRAKNFKYLGSTVSSNERCEEEVRRRIQAGWMSWRKMSGILCDRKLSAKVKGKMYKSVVRPTILYGMEMGQ